MSKDIYLRLIERLNKNLVKFPPIEPVQDFVKLLFDEKQAALGAGFPMGAHSLRDLRKVLAQETDDLESLLDQMEADGLIYSSATPGGEKAYSLVPWIPGLFEHQFLKGEETEKSRKVAQLYTEIMDTLGPAIAESYKKPSPPGKDIFQLRTLAVEEELPNDIHMATWEQISTILDQEKSFAAGMCMCREIKRINGDPCKIEGVPTDTCVYFGEYADYMVAHEYCRRLTKQELQDLVQTCRNHGLVPNINNWQGDNIVMCNCCGCCCTFLNEVKSFGKNSRRQVRSNFIAQVDMDSCIGCGTCVDICQVNALTMDDDETATVDDAYCIGCGNCVLQCPTDSLSLRRCSDTIPPSIEKLGLTGLGR